MSRLVYLVYKGYPEIFHSACGKPKKFYRLYPKLTFGVGR